MLVALVEDDCYCLSLPPRSQRLIEEKPNIFHIFREIIDLTLLVLAYYKNKAYSVDKWNILSISGE